MKHSSPEHLGDSQGQQRAAGNVLVGLGGMAAAVASVAMVRDVTLRFIDAPTMLAFGIAMVCIGVWQRRS